MNLPQDFLSAQGARAFGTRLRRFAETLNGGVLAAYEAAGIEFEPRWFGLTQLLLQHGRVDIGTASAALGQSHVAVVQVANALESRGFVRRVRSKTDRRSRSLEITAKGRALAEKLAPLWWAVAIATEQLLAEAAPDFLAQLDALETALAACPFAARIAESSTKTRSRP
jgi:MarR family transcriptional regulator, organic hydroperoxide resistance regulator